MSTLRIYSFYKFPMYHTAVFAIVIIYKWKFALLITFLQSFLSSNAVMFKNPILRPFELRNVSHSGFGWLIACSVVQIVPLSFIQLIIVGIVRKSFSTFFLTKNTIQIVLCILYSIMSGGRWSLVIPLIRQWICMLSISSPLSLSH